MAPSIVTLSVKITTESITLHPVKVNPINPKAGSICAKKVYFIIV